MFTFINKMDYLKVFGVILIFVLLGVGAYYSNQKYQERKFIEYNGVKISQEDYQRAKEVNEDNLGFKVCDIETGDCIQFTKIEELKKVMEIGR